MIAVRRMAVRTPLQAAKSVFLVVGVTGNRLAIGLALEPR